MEEKITYFTRIHCNFHHSKWKNLSLIMGERGVFNPKYTRSWLFISTFSIGYEWKRKKKD